jgi:hypothetical protein
MTTVIVSGMFALVGALIGVFAQILFHNIRRRHEQRERLIDLYASWVTAIESCFEAYVRETGATAPYSHTESTIRLLERDESILKKMDAVHACFPDPRSKEFEEMNLEAMHIPNWDDFTFRQTMDDLIKLIRKNC